ncbi:MAG: DNA polymerase III subunit beta [Mycoplasmataceae bacterium]|nr:DNA polymerase III subunit beta [Mycoplasmataceae bacterium]
MEITIKRNKEFKNIIKNISSIIDNNSIRPVLSCLSFNISDGVLNIIAANEIISINKIVDKTIYSSDQSGHFLVNGKVFEQIISKTKGDEVTIKKTQDNSLYISSTESEYFVNLYVDSEFPRVNFNYPEDNIFEMKASSLSAAVKKTVFAASEKDQRVILNGINVKIKDGTIIFSATDGFRISRYSSSIEHAKDMSETIHVKAMREITKLVEPSSDLKISITKEWLYVDDKGSVIKSKVIDGIYPNLDRIFPKERLNSVTVNKTDILDMIDRVMVISPFSTEISIDLSNEQMKIKNNQQQVGNAEVVKKNHTYEGKEENISFSVNPRYILDAIKHIDGEDIRIDVNGTLKPIIISSSSDKHMFNLVQPLKV